MDRRAFLRLCGGGAAGAALASLPTSARAQRANRLRLALLGFGARGQELALALGGTFGAEVVGVADLYDGRLRRAREVLGDQVEVVREARRLIDRRDVEAVLIATPDHWHVPLAVAAAQAGKDVWCESPVTHTRAESARLRSAFGGEGRVFQAPGPWPGPALLERAREAVSAGRLGRVTLVEGTWDSSSALEAWLVPFPPDTSPESIDFAAFLGAAPRREFDPHRFFRWQRYWDYGTGLAGERTVPQAAAVVSLLAPGALRRVTATGGVRRWKDGREVPDTLLAVLEYESGLTVALSASQNGLRRPPELRLVGTEGTLVLGPDRLVLHPDPAVEPYPEVGETWPREHRDWFYMMHGLTRSGLVRGAGEARRVAEEFAAPPSAAGTAVALGEFVQAVRARRPSAAALTAALEAAEAGHRVNEAFRAAAAEARPRRGVPA